MTSRMHLDDGRTGSVTEHAPLTYQPAFDGLRAMAVCMVTGYHVDKTILPGGWAGVDVFFVLSGYLITRVLSRTLRVDERISFRDFYMRRILRLVPAFWCLLAAVAITAPLRSDPISALKAVVASGTYTINWTRAFHLWPQDILGHTWSLAIEEQFYIVWPVLFLSIYTHKPARCLRFAIVAILVWRCILVASGADTVRIYMGFDTHSDGLLLGCLLAFTPPSKALAGHAARTYLVPLIALTLILATCDLQSRFVQTIGFSAVAFISTWLIVAAQEPGPLQRWLVLRPLVYTGRISYGFYLWHYPLIALANERYGLKGSLAAVAIAYVVATVSHETIEKGFLRLRPRASGNLRQRRSDETAEGFAENRGPVATAGIPSSSR